MDVSFDTQDIQDQVDETAVSFRSAALEYICATTEGQLDKLYHSNFGLSVDTTARIWVMLVHWELLPDKAKPKHLLWTLFFLRKYLTEDTMVIFLKTSAKTICLWIRLFLVALRDLACEHMVST